MSELRMLSLLYAFIFQSLPCIAAELHVLQVARSASACHYLAPSSWVLWRSWSVTTTSKLHFAPSVSIAYYICMLAFAADLPCSPCSHASDNILQQWLGNVPLNTMSQLEVLGSACLNRLLVQKLRATATRSSTMHMSHAPSFAGAWREQHLLLHVKHLKSTNPHQLDSPASKSGRS